MKLLSKKKILVALLILYAVIALTSIINKSVTYDEITYITSGYAIWQTRDYRLNEEHPPLAKLIAGFPLLFIKPNINFQDKAWIEDKQWEFAQNFFFHSNNNVDLILFYARMPFILIGILLGIYVFKFSETLYGTKAGFLSLFLYAFSPNIIAHSRLATTDFIITAFIFITFYYFYNYLKHNNKKHLFLTGIFYGLSLASKFTSLYFVPVFFILAFLNEFLKKPKLSVIRKKSFLKKNIQNFKEISFLLVIAFLILALTYSFQINVFFSGINQVIKSSKLGRFSYLLGKHYIGGNILFYPVAFLIKTPIAFLILLILSILFRNKFNYKFSEDIFILIPLAVFLIPTIFFNKINLGLRHILVIYPFLYVYVGNIINIRKGNYLLIIVMSFYIVSSLSIYPNFLAYFNEFVLPSKGAYYLIDSNIDWGQDLKQLSLYLERKNITYIYLAYSGNDNPSYRKINYTKLSCLPQQGMIAISVNELFGIKESDYFCYKWLHNFEPIEKIGYSLWVYNITENFSQEYIREHIEKYKQALKKDLEIFNKPFEEECKEMCINFCKQQGKSYKKSGLTDGKCGCSCT